jgi:hypothetical protein
MYERIKNLNDEEELIESAVRDSFLNLYNKLKNVQG